MLLCELDEKALTFRVTGRAQNTRVHTEVWWCGLRPETNVWWCIAKIRTSLCTTSCARFEVRALFRVQTSGRNFVCEKVLLRWLVMVIVGWGFVSVCVCTEYGIIYNSCLVLSLRHGLLYERMSMFIEKIMEIDHFETQPCNFVDELLKNS